MPKDLIFQPNINAYCLSNSKQRTKVNIAHSSFGVPQGFILGLILFNIFLNDFLLVINDTDFSSYVDGDTMTDSGNSIHDLILSLQESSEKLFHWFFENQMNGNTDKCHLTVRMDGFLKT